MSGSAGLKVYRTIQRCARPASTPPLASAPKFYIRYTHPISLVIIANGCGYTQGLFWLPWEIILVGQGSRIEATQNLQNLPDVRFFNIRVLFLSLAHASAKTQVQRCLYREVDEIWQYCIGGNLTIFDKDHDLFLQPSIRLRYNYYVQLVATKRGRMRVPNVKFWSSRQRGGWKLVVHIAVLGLESRHMKRLAGFRFQRTQ